MKETNPLPSMFTMPPNLPKNQLLYGDNLTIMRTMPNACVDLIYLDPPWNSKKNYNLIYKKLTGQPVPEQEEAFCDTWEMDTEKEEMARRMPIVLRDYGVDEGLVMFWKAWIDALRHTQPRLLAYLIYMTYRLFEMRRILKPTGSIYLHCDPTASHYIKVIMDGVFGHSNFRNEIIWCYDRWISVSADFQRNHDVILRYSKTKDFIFNTIREIDEKRRKTLERGYTTNLLHNGERQLIVYKGSEHKKNIQELIKKEKFARVLYREPEGNPLRDWWAINIIHPKAKERLGYPTQKPITLLKRIIEASSNPNDIVFDPFCGCGTTIYAAYLLGRKWIGCDIAILSVRLIRDVLLKRYGLKEEIDYEVSGVPLSVEGAEYLFDRDPRQFQHWSVELAGGFASTKTTGDKGIDGRVHFETEGGKLKNMVLSVKGGKLTPEFMRELRGVVDREESDTKMGGLICLQQPTKGMWDEVASAGIYTYLGKAYDKLQIRTVQELLDGKGFDTPSKVPTLGWKNQIVMPI
jgi:site-specific DNA-methyltransferase (adenine-specific)